MNETMPFPAISDKPALESGTILAPKFNRDGLVTAVVTDHEDGTLLMVAHMNDEALALTLESGIAHFFSRSRQRIWKKGETSGNLQTVEEIRVDCDQDAVWLKVSVAGHQAACHTGRKSCFYRRIEKNEAAGRFALVFDDDTPRFNPRDVYETR